MVQTTARIYLRDNNGNKDSFTTSIKLSPEKIHDSYMGNLFRRKGKKNDMICYAVEILCVKHKSK